VRLDDTWGPSDTEGLRRQSFRDGLLLIAAAANLDKAGQHGPPIIWRLPNVVGVGAVDANRNIPAGARYSRADIDLVAPGVGVPLHKVGGGMECHDGTSFATAYVTAIAALLLESPFVDRNPRLVRARLLATADWIPAYAGHVRGGLVNARRALRHLDKNSGCSA
jgi:subtilisin family serine protease